MPVVLNVNAEFNQRAAAEAARDAERYYERRAAQLKVDAKLNEASARKAEGDAKEYFLRKSAELKVEAKLDERSARLAHADAKRIFTRIGRDSGSSFTGGLTSAIEAGAPAVERSLSGVTQSFTELGAVVGAVGRVGGPAVLAGLAGAAVEVAGVAASAAQALWLLPAAAGAAGAAFGTLTIATLGFGDAMKNMGDPEKFAESLKNLAPNAQQAATSIKQLVDGPLKGLQQATQNALFAGVGQQLNALANQYLPAVQSMTTGIAGAFNQMFSGLTNQLMTPETQASMQTFMQNVTASFQALAPAVAPLTKALADIMAVGSGFLPELAQAATTAAQAFSQFISEAKQSGNLKRWMSEGLDTLKLLGGMAIDLATAFTQLAPTAQKILPDIAKMLGNIKDVMPLIGAAAVLVGPSIGVWSLALEGAKNSVDMVSGAFNAITGVVKTVGNAVIPVLNRIGQAIDTMLLTPIRGAIGAANLLPGVNIPQIPGIGTIPLFSDAATGNGTPSENRTSRRPAPLPTAGINPFTPGSTTPKPGWGLPDNRSGWNPQSSYTPTPAAPSSSSTTTPPAFSGGTSGYPGDAALLAHVPAGRYDASGDLARGLGDCSSAVEDLVNLLDGRSTAGRSMATGNAAQWLTAHGFLPGMGGPGDFRVGFNSGHMQATLPGGTPFNWGSDAAAARGGVGGTGADDSAFTSHYYRPAGASAGRGAGTPMGAGDAVPVFVVNFDSMMGGSRFTDPASSSSGGTGGKESSGGTDLLGSFAKGLQSGGGWGGVAGTIISNISSMVGGFNSGGGVDTVPAMLTPGEHVLTTADVAAMGGQQGVYAFRNSLHRSGGGDVSLGAVPPGNPWGWFGSPSPNDVYRDANKMPWPFGGPKRPNFTTPMPSSKDWVPSEALHRAGGGDIFKQAEVPRDSRDTRWGWGPRDPFGRHPTRSDIPGKGISGGPSWGIGGSTGRDDITFPWEPRKDFRNPDWDKRQGIHGFAEGGGVGSQHDMAHDPGFFGPALWQEGPKPGSGWIPTGPGPYPGVHGAGRSARWWADWRRAAGKYGGWNPSMPRGTQTPPEKMPGLGFAKGGAVGFSVGGSVQNWAQKAVKSAQQPKTPSIGAIAQAGMKAGQQVQDRQQGEGGWQPGAMAGGGGGLIGQVAGMLPGGQIVSQLATRAAEFGGQALAIGASGIMETFLPSGSELGDPSKSWFGRLASGFGGARPSVKNTAGTVQPAQTAQQGAAAGFDAVNSKGGGAPLIGEMHYNGKADDAQAAAREINRQVNAYGSGSGW